MIYVTSKNKYRYLIFVLSIFLLSIGTFAWFTVPFVSRAISELVSARIAGFKVEFSDINDNVSEVFSYNLETVFPGMDDYTVTFNAVNKGDIDAKISGSVNNVVFAGHNIDSTAFVSDYPFKHNFKLYNDVSVISPEQSTKIFYTFGWDYESDMYYHLPDFYEYSTNVDYYTFADDKYIICDDVNDSNFNDLKTNLYLYKDDFDTFLYNECSSYLENGGTKCLSFDINLIAKQY